MRTPRATGVLVAVTILTAACGGSSEPSTFPEGAFAIRASSDIGIGRERLLVGVGDAAGTRLGSPDDAVTITVHPEGAPDAAQTTEGQWTWIVEGAIGLYRATFDFDEPGIWEATVIPEAGPALDPVLFSVAEDPFAPGIGARAPAAPTPTLADMPMAELTTDPDPDAAFYETSLPDALAAGDPIVLVFSTPAYCQTAACGPLLDHVKEIAPDHPGVTFIHVEVYTGLTDPDFIPDAAHLAPAVGPEWYNLPSEPWVFVIDENGIVTGRFEGVMDPAELRAMLQ